MADGKISIQVEVLGAEKANKQIQSIEASSEDLKEGLKGVGEGWKGVGELVKANGSVMGESLNLLGDSTLALVDSIFVLKDGMAAAGASGKLAWGSLLGPISLVIGAVALAVETYKSFSGATLQAEENLENMAAAASDTASRLEAMVEAGIELSTESLKEFIQTNERARLQIEQVIKINEKRASSQLKVTEAEKGVIEASKALFFSETRLNIAKADLISAQTQYNKLLDEQTAKSREANKAQKESYELEQLITNDLQFYIDEYQGQIDAQKENLELVYKLTDAKNKDYLSTISVNEVQRKASEEIIKATKVQKIYDDLLSKGQITQNAYDEVVRRNKQTLKDYAEQLKSVNDEAKNSLKLREAEVNIERANNGEKEKATKTMGSSISAIDKRISKMEELTKIEKGYLSNLSNQLKIEALLKETVLGGAEAVNRKKIKEIELIAKGIQIRESEYKTLKDMNEQLISQGRVTLKEEAKLYLERKKAQQETMSLFENTGADRFEAVYQDMVDDLNQMDTDFNQRTYELVTEYENEILGKRGQVLSENVDNLYKIYQEYYANVNDLNKIAYDLELKDLNEQESKLKLSKKKNKEELEQITKKKAIAEQTFISEQAKLQLKFEEDMASNFIKIEISRLDEILKLKEQNASKEIIQLELKAQKEKISRDKALEGEISAYKKHRPAIYSLFVNENAKISKLIDDFNSNQELKTLETEKKKLDIETKSIQERLSKLREFTNETGKINQTIRENTRVIQILPQVEMSTANWKKATQDITDLSAQILDETASLYFNLQKELDPEFTPFANRANANEIIQTMMDASRESLTPEILSKIDKYREKWAQTQKVFEDTTKALEQLTYQTDLDSGWKFNFMDLPMDYGNVLTQLSTLREKYNIDPTQNIEEQLTKLREGYLQEEEALRISLEQKTAITEEYNQKIQKANQQRAEKNVETQREEYGQVREMLYGLTDAYAQSASANIATAFFQGESIKEALKNTLQSLAIESTSKALYETAAGFASLAIPGMQASAGLHFKAAAMYGSVALLAGLGTKLAPPSGGSSSQSPSTTSPSGISQGGINQRPVEDQSNVQNFYINFGGAVIYDTRRSAELAMANRIMSLGAQRGQSRSIQFRDR